MRVNSGFIGDDILPSYMGIIPDHCKDPYFHRIQLSTPFKSLVDLGPSLRNFWQERIQTLKLSGMEVTHMTGGMAACDDMSLMGRRLDR